MNETFWEKFPVSEYDKRREICGLMNDWANEFASVVMKDPNDGKIYKGSEFFCWDGFYPYYFRQKRKILFIAREPVSIAGYDYIELLLDAYNNNKNVGTQSLDQSLFHRRMMYVAYGILQDGKPSYRELPYASKIAADFGTEKGISFAFMELSKYSNEDKTANQNRDIGLMNAFLRDSNLEKRNFFQEELSILAPDIVITMNLWDNGIERRYLDLAFGNLTYVEGSQTPKTSLNFITINGKETPLIDLFHFSKPGSDEAGYYNPVMDIIKNHLNWDKN